jgi:hypothetical protein
MGRQEGLDRQPQGSLLHQPVELLSQRHPILLCPAWWYEQLIQVQMLEFAGAR